MRHNEPKAIAAQRTRRNTAWIACLAAAFIFLTVLCVTLAGCASKNTDERVVVIQNIPGETVHTLSSGGTRTVVDVVEQVADTVVEINCTVKKTQYDFFGRPYETTGTAAGSGVLFAANGYIITNHHVIEDATEIAVRLRDGTQLSATLIGSDSEGDIAVIKADKDLPFASFGSSADLKVGQPVVVIGNPLGTLGGTVTDGIVSALDRELTVEGTKMKLLQTNASINSGNSGGGMFDMDGRLIGIVNAKSTGTNVEGLGFAIPSDTAQAIAVKLINESK